MDSGSEAGQAGALRRVRELEEQLARSARAEEAHGYTEAGLRAELGYAASIVDTVREPLLVLDGKLRVKTASRAFYHTFGLSRENTEGQYIYNLGNGEWDIPALRTLLEEILPQRRSFNDFEVIHDFPDLGCRVMLLNARNLWTEERDEDLMLVAIEDVTDRKRIQDELVSSNEDLQRFAYMAAHDLRAPLNAALTFSQLLARRLEGKLDEQEHGMLLQSIESMERLRALMNDILTYSEMGNAPQQRTLMPLGEPLNIALANLQHHIAGSGAVIGVEALPEVPVDRTQMVMIFQNLIGNALKYRRDQTPSIRIEAVRQDSRWLVSVRDNGQGFEAEYAVVIFEPFKRLHGRNVPGSGIGLATCKRIIERFGGRIWAESVPGEGSTFYFTLPLQ